MEERARGRDAARIASNLPANKLLKGQYSLGNKLGGQLGARELHHRAKSTINNPFNLSTGAHYLSLTHSINNFQVISSSSRYASAALDEFDCVELNATIVGPIGALATYLAFGCNLAALNHRIIIMRFKERASERDVMKGH